MKRLIESLHLLAAAPSDQRTALPPFVAFADELALIFDDELRVTKLDELPPATRATLEELDQTLDRMSKEPRLWTDKAVASDQAWASIRDHARALLRALGEEPRAPDLFWLTFEG